MSTTILRGAVGGGALEQRVAVAEAQPGVAEEGGAPGGALVDLGLEQRVGDLGTVGADVLHRGGPGRAGDPGQGLEPGKPGGQGLGDGVVPRGGPAAMSTRIRPSESSWPDRHARGGDLQHRAGVSGVVDQQVGAAGNDQQLASQPRPPRRPRR